MTDEGEFSTGIRILASDSIDISGQPSGTSMIVRARWLNTKEQRLYGWWLQWD